jgi:hypothetical protein
MGRIGPGGTLIASRRPAQQRPSVNKPRIVVNNPRIVVNNPRIVVNNPRMTG